MRIIFAGTPEFAVPSLRALLGCGQEILFVITQPDRPKGRHRKLLPPPVKIAAMELGLPVRQWEDINAPDSIEELRAAKPDLIVVVAYGQFLSRAALAVPRFGCWNVHASLLPRHRGAAPINWAIISGDAVTGVTLQQMAPKMDTGDILMQESTPIGPEETAGELSVRLGQMGADLLPRALRALESGTLAPIPQDHARATFAPLLRKQDGELDWSRPAVELERFVRGMTPWPGAFTTRHSAGRAGGTRLIVLRLRPSAHHSDRSFPPGALICDGKTLLVQTGDHPARIEILQPAGGCPMSAEEYLRGHPVHPGDWLGPEEASPLK